MDTGDAGYDFSESVSCANLIPFTIKENLLVADQLQNANPTDRHSILRRPYTSETWS